MNTIEIFKGSILDTQTDVLVNPANSFLRHGGGLAAVIQKAAIGPLDYANGYVTDKTMPDAEGNAWIMGNARQPNLATGDARMVSPGHLADHGFKALIHAVGPIWAGGDLYERPLVREAYDRSLILAEDAGYESIAFPAISAGIFGVPIDLVAEAAAMMCCHTSLDVTFALMDDDHVKAFETAIARYRA